MANTCPCQSDLECLGKDDGNLCNGVPYCHKLTGQCQPNPATAVSCPSAGDTACLKNLCAPTTGLCAPTPVNLGASCSDGNS